jgi:hypothetical protein
MELIFNNNANGLHEPAQSSIQAMFTYLITLGNHIKG